MDIRKALAVTTALTAVGTVASGAALAAEKPKISLGGFYELFLGGADQKGSFSTSNGTPQYDGGARPNTVGMVHYGEIHFTVDGTLDSGTKYRIRFEKVADDKDISGLADSSAGQTAKKVSTDEAWVELTGSWGRLILGGQDGPADQYEGADQFVYTGAREHAIFADINNGNVSGADKTNIEDSSDATKIYYSTPRVSGFRVGYSYSFSGDATGSINETGGNAFHEAAVEYRGKIGDGTLRAIANYVQTNVTAVAGDNELNGWRVSANYAMGPWTVGGGYVDNDIKDDTKESTAWDVGGAYNGGKWEAGIYYLKSEAEDTSSRTDTYKQWSVSGVYNLGGGMSVAATLTFFDLERNSGSSSTNGNTDGWAGIVKTSFRF